jgi:hypothetical protein
MSPKQTKPIPFHASKSLLDWVLELSSQSSAQIKLDRKGQPARRARQVLRALLEQRVLLGLLVLPALLALQVVLAPLALLAILVRWVRRGRQVA